MSHLLSDTTVATLVAAGDTGLSQDFLATAQKNISITGATQPQLNWLAENKAADLVTSYISIEALQNLLQELIQQQPIDILVQPEATRRKALLIADMESTIIEQEMLDELASAIGVGERVADITRRAMNGELDFAAALKERVGLLKGQPETLLTEVGRRVTFMPGARELVATMRANGAACWLVSGGFTGFAAPIAHELGFSEAYANRLTITDGIVTGEVAEPILDKNTKKALLEFACKQFNIAMATTLAVGDGANDVPMLAASNLGGGLGVAYRAKPSVRTTIANQINYGDLTALLYAQGYKKEEFQTNV